MEKIENKNITVRRAVMSDGDILCELINALADYEKKKGLDGEGRIRLKQDAFSSSPLFETYLADYEGRSVAYAIILYMYSTFSAKPILYIEDIFVLPEYRSKGVGKSLFEYCMKLALEKKCYAMKWSVLHWNTPAIDFYKRYGAEQIDEWLSFSLTNEKLSKIIN